MQSATPCTGIPVADIELATRVHYGFMPRDHTDTQLDLSVRLQPSARIGGDYCGMICLGDGDYLLSMCDAVGHGIASALYAARINAWVLMQGPQIRNPARIVYALNHFLCTHLAEVAMNASLFVARLDMRNQHLDYFGAGHPPPLHYDAGTGRVSELQSQTTLLGIVDPLPGGVAADEADEGNSGRIDIATGDRLLLYTDGVSEARGEAGEEYGLQALKTHFGEYHALTVREYTSRLSLALDSHSNGYQHDDRLLMCARFSPRPG